MTRTTEALRGFVRGRAGISMGADKDYLILSRLEPHLRDWGMTSLDGLAAHLSTDPRGRVAEQPLFCKFPRGVSFGSIAQASMVR